MINENSNQTNYQKTILHLKAELAVLNKSIMQAHQTAEILRSAHVALSQSLDMNVLCETLLDAFYELIPYDSATFFC